MTTPKPLRHLLMARVLGACAIAVLGQFFVDMPGGYFGTADDLTPVGAAYSLLALLGALAAAVAFALDRPIAPWLSLLVVSFNSAAFIPPLMWDPLPSGLVLAWQVHILVRHFTPYVRETAVSPFAESAATFEVSKWIRDWGPAVRHMAIVSILGTVAVVGYETSHHLVPQIAAFSLNGLTVVATLPFLKVCFKHSRRLLALLVTPLVLVLFSLARIEAALVLLLAFQVILLWALLNRDPLIDELIQHFYAYPAIFVIVSFLGLVALGTLLLSFPAASATGASIKAVDALFTAVSAVCVTGLTVIDTATGFSTFGHVVLLGLFQVGGLGIMVLSTGATLILSGSLGLRGERAVGDLLELPGTKSLYRLIRFIVISTFAIEAIGAAALTYAFHREGLPLADAAWKGVFHAVSAFCNAGFVLQTDSLRGFGGKPSILIPLAILIILGGIGFPVLAALFDRYVRGRRRPLTVQVRLILVMTVSLILIGWLMYLGAEWDASLAGFSIGDKILNSFFQAVSLRTAGFTAVDVSALRPATMAFIVVLMFIGGAPGSTGGGIKVTTAGILLAAVPSLGLGRGSVHLFHRRISEATLFRSISVVVVTITLITSLHFLLLLSGKHEYEVALFEATSAVATVGLSVGATAELDVFGKFLIIFGMFSGRVGPLTTALAFTRQKRQKVTLPEEAIMVG